jgi:hypothetical protein
MAIDRDGGADAADPLGGMSVHHQMNLPQRVVGLWGGTRRRPQPALAEAG